MISRHGGQRRRFLSLGTALLLTLYSLAFLANLSPPVGATGGETYYLGLTPTGSCPGRCENLATSSGTADKATSQHIRMTTGDYEVEPDINSTDTTGTPSVTTPSGYAWETSSAIGGTIVSGTWTLDLTTQTNKASGSASLWATVWSCQNANLGACTLLFKDWDNTTNILLTKSPTSHAYTTGTVGPFPNVRFLVLEWWVHYSSSGSSNGATVTETTGSADSKLLVPNLRFSASASPGISLSPVMNEALAGITESTSASLSPVMNEALAGITESTSASLSPSFTVGAVLSAFESAPISLAPTMNQALRGATLGVTEQIAPSLTQAIGRIIQSVPLLLSSSHVSPALEVAGTLSESASASLAPSLGAITTASPEEDSIVVVANGQASSNQTSVTGVSVMVTGLNASNGARVGIDTRVLVSPGSGVAAAPLADPSFFDVEVSGSYTGTAAICAQYPLAGPKALLEYYYDGAWDVSAGVSVKGTTVCGSVPLSALKGTRIALGNPPAPGPSRLSLTCSATLVAVGSSVQCTSTVTGSSPSGSVTWTSSGSGSVSMAPAGCSLAQGACTVDVFGETPGPASLIAQYSGDKNNAGSQGQATLTVVEGASNSTTTTASSPSTASITGNSYSGSTTSSTSGATSSASTSAAPSVQPQSTTTLVEAIIAVVVLLPGLLLWRRQSTGRAASE